MEGVICLNNANTSNSVKIFTFFNYSFLILFSLFAVIPFVLVFMTSITNEGTILKDGYSLLPSRISFAAYSIILGKGSSVLHAYMISILVTTIGTFFSLLITSMLAYGLSVNEIRYKNPLLLFVFFTMLFSGGLVPWYIVCTQYLGLKNTIWALILPLLLNPWNMYLLRNFFSKLPGAIADAAKIDGAGGFTILFRVIMPMSKPALATIGLFIALGYWNDWFNALMLVDKENILPMQYLLFKVQSDVHFAASRQSKFSSQFSMPQESIKMATTILAIGPILLVYPFVQKYFIKGISLGALK